MAPKYRHKIITETFLHLIFIILPIYTYEGYIPNYISDYPTVDSAQFFSNIKKESYIIKSVNIKSK
uniref:Uncharacterized protein n=1 Tax=Octopus bimaculoides TaxID=37653 RepID=A0A0L8I3F2_OCTBM